MNGAAFGTCQSRRNLRRLLGDLSKTDRKNIATLGDLRRFKATYGDFRRLEVTLYHSSDINLNLALISPYTLKFSTKSLAINLYCTNHLFNFLFTYINSP